MIKFRFVRRTLFALGVIALGAMSTIFLSRALRAGQDSQQGQASAQQGQQGQSQGQNQQQQKPKKKGGFFSGLKEVTGTSSAQTSDTTSAGAKGVGEGDKIGNVTPTAADLQAVTNMEAYSVPKDDLTKFVEDGHLKPKK